MVFLLKIDCDPPALWSSGNAPGGSHGSRVPCFWATPNGHVLYTGPSVPCDYDLFCLEVWEEAIFSEVKTHSDR